MLERLRQPSPACAAKRVGRIVLFAVVATSLLIPVARAGDPMPVIVTFELSKMRKNAQAQAHDPKNYWIGEIVARISDKKPSIATRLKAPVVVQVHFAVGRDGRIMWKQVSRSSGIPGVDAVGLAMLDKAAPFPPMPASLRESEVAFTLPFRFH